MGYKPGRCPHLSGTVRSSGKGTAERLPSGIPGCLQ
nr:MAG TPA_asm: hypothetical protein [Caudoviricetes sp.]